MKIRSSKTVTVSFAVFSIIVLLLAFLSLRPLPKASQKNCVKHTGTVTDVTKGNGKGDIVIKVKNSNNYFYINRAMDNGYTVEALKEKLLSREAEVLTISHWTPLDPASRTKHIAELKVGSEIVYTEL